MANADDLKNLAQEMGKAYEDRVTSLTAIRRETAKLLNAFQKESKGRHREVSGKLKEFDKARKEMSTQLKATLRKDEADRVAQTQAEIKARADEMAKMLAEFDKTQAEMAAQLKATLEKDEADRKSQAVAEVKQRAADVAELLDGFRRDQAETTAAWQELLSTMRSGREAKPIVEKKAPPKEVVEEVAVEKVKEIPVGKSLEKQVLFLIEDSPEGIKLTDMEKILGVARIKLGGMTRSLLEVGKIRKEGMLYFPKEEE